MDSLSVTDLDTITATINTDIKDANVIDLYDL